MTLCPGILGELRHTAAAVLHCYKLPVHSNDCPDACVCLHTDSRNECSPTKTSKFRSTTKRELNFWFSLDRRSILCQAGKWRSLISFPITLSIPRISLGYPWDMRTHRSASSLREARKEIYELIGEFREFANESFANSTERPTNSPERVLRTLQ